MADRKFYHSPTPKFEFDTYEEKRRFKQAVRRTLREQLGYYHERDFLADVYRILASGNARRLIEFLENRLKLYGEVMQP